MTAYNSRETLIVGLRNRLHRVMEKHMGNNWPEALMKIDMIMGWIREAEQA